jgi:hypothetical protein
MAVIVCRVGKKISFATGLGSNVLKNMKYESGSTHPFCRCSRRQVIEPSQLSGIPLIDYMNAKVEATLLLDNHAHRPNRDHRSRLRIT